MAIELVTPSSAIDMIGPYLTAKVTCPFCKLENVLLYLESYSSAVKPHEICQHLAARDVLDGETVFEFDSERVVTTGAAGEG
ncbi:hypothetical protein [Pseudomonas sp. EMN2]|uniref:hypothetical protein n=1 Tax=Pseudomonas sp. EMN2 TaxID=2615212 RepID=UPI00129B9E23|nr:hypothetical protein [Pseudomonas sp. EMN2]